MQRELLEQHSRNPVFSDVTFVSGISGERIPGHRIIQASSSHYFAELFSQNPDKKVFQLPRPIQPITQPYVFDKSLIPQDPTKDEKQEDAPVEEAKPDAPAEDKKEEKVNAAKLLGLGRGKIAAKKESDDMKGLSERPPATLDPTRSILSLTYVLQKTDENTEEEQPNPLGNQNNQESGKFSLLSRLSPPITPQNCLIFYTLASSLKLKQLEGQLLEYISQYLLTPTSSCALFLESSKFDIPDLMQHALEIISQNFSQVLDQNSQKRYLLRLSYDYFKELVSRDDLWIDSEDKILDLVIDYMKEREGLQRRIEDIQGDKKKDGKAILQALAGGVKDNAEEKIEEEKKEEEAKNPPTKVQGEGDEQKEEEETHKNLTDLEKEAGKRMKRFKLNDKEKKELLLLLRYKFISHERLLTASKVNPNLSINFN